MSINTSSNFLVGAALPADDKIIKADITARDAIPAIQRYAGMIVTVQSPLQSYQLGAGLTNADWVPFGTGAVTMIGSVDCIPFVDHTDVNLLRTNVFFNRNVSTGLIYNSIGFNASIDSIYNVYVSTTGSDSNTGYDPLSPWLTIAHAISQANLAGGGKYVINVADGTYSTVSFDVPDTISRQVEDLGLETMIEIVGNETTPGNVIFSNTSSTILYQNSGKTVLFVRGVQFQGGGANTCINQSSGKIYLRNVNFHNFGRVSNSYRDSEIYTFAGTNGIVITDTFTGFVGDSSLTFFNNSNITMSPVSAASPCNLFTLYNSSFINGTGTTITVNGFPITGTGYYFTAKDSYINLGIFSGFTGSSIDGPFYIDGCTYVDVGDNNSLTFTGSSSIAIIKGKSYINDAGTNIWNFSSVPASGIQLSGDGQFASPAILRSGILILNDIVDYITYPSDQNYTRYSFDNRYTDKIVFTALGKLTQGASTAEIGPLGETTTMQPLYIATGKAQITNLNINTRVSSGFLLPDTYTIYVNNIATALSVSIVNSNAGSVTGIVNLVAGDVVTLRFSTSIITQAEDLYVQFIVRVLE